MKRLVIISLLLLCLSFTSHAATTEIALHINGQAVELEHPLIETQPDVLLAPMEEFFAALQVPVDILPNDYRAVFRDNIFIKFRTDYNRYEINGREYAWTVTPRLIDGVLYGPIDVFLRFMDLEGSFSPEEQVLDIRTSRAIVSFRPDSYATKQVSSLGTGLTYSVPTFWEAQDSGGYGTRLLNQRILIDLKRIITDQDNLRDISHEYLLERTAAHDGFQVQPLRTLDSGLFEAFIYTYRLINPKLPAEQENHIISYGFFELNNQFFVAVLDSNLRDNNFLDQVLNDVLRSIQSKTYSIDSLSEHYVEFRNYSRFFSFISSPIYSNIQVSGELAFRGNLDPAIEYLDVLVEKGDRDFEYQIPVVYGSFDDRIPIPFGLGFHRVTILLPESIEGQEDLYLQEDDSTLLKFSVINRALGESLLVSSSKLVDKNHEQVQAAVAPIDESLTNYEKAYQAFLLLEQFGSSSHTTMEQLLATGSGSSKAVASLYTAYLRAMDIPTRMVRNSLIEEYFVEFFSNGKWIFTRPSHYIRVKDRIEVYFDVPRPQGIQIELLDY